MQPATTTGINKWEVSHSYKDIRKDVTVLQMQHGINGTSLLLPKYNYSGYRIARLRKIVACFLSFTAYVQPPLSKRASMATASLVDRWVHCKAMRGLIHSTATKNFQFELRATPEKLLLFEPLFLPRFVSVSNILSLQLDSTHNIGLIFSCCFKCERVTLTITMLLSLGADVLAYPRSRIHEERGATQLCNRHGSFKLLGPFCRD